MELNDLYQLYLDCGMRVSTDTRQLKEGEMFVALKGDNFNGNLFTNQALEKGAGYVIVDEETSPDPRVIKVENGLLFLQQLARLHRKTLKPRLIGIGGSNGKTTTKELLVSILSTEYKVLSTKGNLNNQIGVPLTLLGLREDDQIAVIEMGANKIGDIKELCDIAEPELGVITNIGKEHLQGFGSIEGVAQAESELFDYLLKNNGLAFVNNDDLWLKNMGQRLTNKVVYGSHDSGLESVITTPDIQFKYKGLDLTSDLMGEHNLQNIMAAICIAEFFHISPEKIKTGIQNYKPQNNRSQWVKTGNNHMVLLDAYNANPSSVEMALQTFIKMQGYKIVVLGDMFELGDFEHSEHQGIADLCQSLPFDHVFLVGKAFALTDTKQNHVKRFEDKMSLKQFFSFPLPPESKILIKGSRGMRMEDLLELF